MRTDSENSSLPRLNLARLDDLASRTAENVATPDFDPRDLTTGIVHLGVGAFHRAHQAVYTEAAAATTADTRWGITAVTGRSDTVVNQLQPQDGLYTVLTKDVSDTSLRVVGSIRNVLNGSTDTDPVTEALARDDVAVTTLTITEKGYPRSESGDLAVGTETVDADTGAIRRTLAAPNADARPGSSVGLLTAGLARRFATSRAPISVVSCDNLPGNGSVLSRLVRQLADASGDAAFTEWLAEAVTFPSTMVDRIVPSTSQADRREASELLGLEDAGLVVAEPFGQWVIEDDFAADRPAWERAGATLTDDVSLFEKAKLRMLNGSHSLLAYLGALRGFDTIADAVSDPDLEAAARSLQRDDVVPTLTAPPGMDLRGYGDEILARYRNPNLRHTTAQVAMDGSQKLPIRIIATAADRLASGAMPDACALTLAAWIVYVYAGQDRRGRRLELNDPAADTLREHAAGDRATLAERMLGLPGMFPAEVAGNDAFRTAVHHYVSSLLREVG